MKTSTTVVSLFGTLALAFAGCTGPEEQTEDDCTAGAICVCEVDEDCPAGEVCSSFLICEPASDTGGDVEEDPGTTDVPDRPDTTPDVDSDVGFIQGACSGNADHAILITEEAWPGCAFTCRTADDPVECADTCLGSSGLSADCAGCFTANVACLLEQCPCIGDADLTEECGECVATVEPCASDLVTCAGDRPPETDPDPTDLGCNDEDREVLDVVAGFEVGRACNAECEEGDDPCLDACLEEGLQVSVACGLCFSEQASCADVSCVVECVEEGDECDTCRFTSCIEVLEECTETEIDLIAEDPVSRLRLLHMTPNATNFSAYLQDSDEPFAHDITFGEASDPSQRIAITSDTLEVREASEGLTGSVLYEATLPEVPGGTEVWTVATYGAVADETSWLLVHDLNDRPGTVRWQFFNASGLLGDVDIYDLGDAEPVQIEEGLVYGSSTERTVVEAGSYTLGIDSDGDAELDYEFAIGPFEFGTEVSLFLFDDDAAAIYLMAVYVDGQTVRYNPRN